MIALLWSLGNAEAATVRASSTLKNDEGTMAAALAFDGQLKTGWAEGVEGNGEGQWLEVDLGAATQIGSVSVWPGDVSNGESSFKEHGRPKVIQLLVDGKPYGGQLTVEDQVERLDVPVGAKGRVVRVQIERAYEGGVYDDCHIAEIAIDFTQGGMPAKMQTWLDSSAGKSARDKYVAELEKAYAAHKGAELGDRAAFAFIADAAAEGAPYVRKAAQTQAPLGYRMQAIPSDDSAREALRKLKDSNAIPALALAALRSSGARQEEIEEEQQIFEAYQDMLGGGGRNVPQWGASGYGAGAFQSLGEPLAIEIDRWGDVLVADTGNNRIQQLTDEGRFKKQWGKAPTDASLPAALTDMWFDKGHDWYASGAQPADEPGAFVNPIDVEIIPQGKGDWWAALDAKNRVQVYDDSGSARIGWSVTTDNVAHPGVGGEGFLAWVPGKSMLVAIVQDEAVGYNLEAEEIARFQITDGIPNAVEVAKNSVLLFAFGSEVIQYNPDGFRYGKVMGSAELGEGFEGLDLTLDESGKLWALTDTGWVYKFKKPGKLELRVRGVDHTLEQPRIAVRDGFVYYTADDHIERIDAYQKKMDAEAAEEEAESGDAEADADKPDKKGKKD
jgi:hypothetical protein